MAQIDNILENIKAMKRKIDSLTIDVGAGSYWTVHVDFWTVEVEHGDYATLHRSLSSLTQSREEEQLVEELRMSMHQVKSRGKMCKNAYCKLNVLLEQGILWLESLKAKA